MSHKERLSGAAFDAALKTCYVQGDEFDLRKFDPSEYDFPTNAVPGDVFNSNTDCCPIVHVDVPTTSKIYKSFKFGLYADGACPGNGTPAARASVGVYGTPDAWYNTGLRLPRYLPQTNQRAEIYSAIVAIRVARDILEKTRPDLGNCGCATILVLAMDSAYVVKAMTKWIRKWRVNGFRDANGLPVENAEPFKKLDDNIRQAYLDRYLVVRFWKIRRKYNFGADKVATEALQGHRFLLPGDIYGDADSDDPSGAHSEAFTAFSGLVIADRF